MADTSTVEAVAAAIGDPVRARILDLLSRGRRDPCCSPTNPELPRAVCACDIRGALGGMAPSRLAYHLKLLRDAGLVGERKRGKWVYYTVEAGALAAFLDAVAARWAEPKPRRRRSAAWTASRS